MSEITEDRSDLPFLSRRLKAAHDIAETELLRTNIQEQATNQKTANLACVEMDGVWNAADAIESSLYPHMVSFLEVGYDRMAALRRDSPRAKIVVTIPAGLTAEQDYVALQRKRLLMRLESDRPDVAPLEVDKISLFALDIQRLAELSHMAVREVRLIVAGAMYRAIDQRALGRNDFGIPAEARDWFERMSTLTGRSEQAFLEALEHQKLFHQALVRYDMTTDEVLERLQSEDPIRLQDPASLEFIESALQMHSTLLTPAATTYYVHS